MEKRIRYSVLVGALAVLVLIQPVFAASSWSGHAPTQSYLYRKNSTDNVKVFNSKQYSDASFGLAVENYQYLHNIDPQGDSAYVLVISANANTRVDHQYSSPVYGSHWDLNGCSPSGGLYCSDTGINTKNGGAWFSTTHPIYYYGHAYNQIFICSNGYVAFVYNQSATTCPSSPSAFPAQATDANGNFLAIPSAVVAPWWTPLDVSRYGTAHIYYKVNLQDPSIGPSTWGITWYNLPIQGGGCSRSGNCFPNCFPCYNYFSITFDSVGRIYFGYGEMDSGISLSTSGTSNGVIGVEDASGTLSTTADPNSAVTGAGFLTNDPNYSPYSNGWLQDLRLNFADQTAGDGASLIPSGITNTLRGYNIQTSAIAHDTGADLYAQIVENVIFSIICDPLDFYACLAITTGDIILQHFIDATSTNAQFTPVTMNDQVSADSGSLETPVQDFTQLCGNTPFGGPAFNGCDTDASVFDVVQWIIPPNFPSTSPKHTHTLSISFDAELGSTYCCTNFSNTGLTRTGPSVTLTVDDGDFTISSTGQSASTIVAGNSLTSTINLGFNSFSTFQTTLWLCSQVSPNTLSSPPQVTFSPQSVSLSANQNAASTMTITTTSGTSGTTPADYSVTVIASDRSDCQGDLVHSTKVPFTVTVPDFSISANPTSINVFSSTPGTSTITIASLNSFSGNVVMAASPISGFTESFSPGTVSVPAGGTSTSTLTISVSGSPSAGTYPVTVTGSSGSLSHPTTISLAYPGDFSISPNSPLTFACPYIAGSTCSTSVPTVSSLNGFSGTVALNANPSPGLSATLSPSSLTVSPSASSSTANLSLSATSGGTYTITVTGTSGSLTHTTATMTFMFYDFSVSLSCGSPGCSYGLTQGSTVQDTLTVTSLGGFWGTVNLSVSAGGQTVSLSASSVTLSSGGQATVTVTITGGSSSGTVTVTGTCVSGQCVSPPQSHSASVGVSISCGCGGGGSVAAGTLITLANGTQVPVQNLSVGMQLLSYNMTTRQYVTITITRFVSVQTDNQMIIRTTTGRPLIVDQNPAQKLEVMFPNGTWTELSVTELKIGDYLFDASTQTWVQVTGIQYVNGGVHTMYDIYTNAPTMNYIANNYLDYVKV